MSAKRVLVTFGTNPVRKKAYTIPEKCPCEINFLKQELVRELFDSVTVSTKSIILSRYDGCFMEEVELNVGDILFDKDKLSATYLNESVSPTANNKTASSTTTNASVVSEEQLGSKACLIPDTVETDQAQHPFGNHIC